MNTEEKFGFSIEIIGFIIVILTFIFGYFAGNTVFAISVGIQTLAIGIGMMLLIVGFSITIFGTEVEEKK